MVLTKARKPLPKTVHSYKSGRRRTERVREGLGEGAVHSETVELPTLLHGIHDEPEIPSSTRSSTYYASKTKRMEEWTKIQESLIHMAFKLNCPQTNECSYCGHTCGSRIARCLDCGPSLHFCPACLERMHSQPHLHVFKIYEGTTFVGCADQSATWRRIDGHECDTGYSKLIIVIDDKGRQHKRNILLCGCETPAVTLLRWNLWASSPTCPELAFHTDLLDWMTALQLECQLSAKGFCEALKFKQSKHYRYYQEREIKVVYKVLITETLEQYRHFQFKVRHPTTICERLDDGTACPSCYLMENKIFSLDADFQLVRKRSSGFHWQKPKHAGRFFLDQVLVDEYVTGNHKDTEDQGCSDFQATNNLRSKVKNSKLDETAVFGSVCRHEYPQLFFSLKHGERLGYAVYLIKTLLSKEPQSDQRLHITYDIACMLDRHLHVLYNVRRTPGLGLTDGESIERLWSYLGGFSKITKEMTPENRIDLLVDGLLHYGCKLKEKIGDVLLGKLEKARTLRSKSVATLTDLQSSHPVQLTTEEDYALELERFYKSESSNRDVLQTDVTDQDHIQAIAKTRHRLSLLERKLDISCRWTSSNDTFKRCLASAKQNKQVYYRAKMKKMVAERSFLLSLMKKYAKGQSVALRLGRQLKRVCGEFHKQVEAYNLLNGPDSRLGPSRVTGTIGSIATEPWWNVEDGSHSDDLKRQAVDLVNFIDRCDEEETMVKAEMCSVLSWYSSQHTILKETIDLEPSALHPGIKSTLIQEGLYVEYRLQSLYKLFSDTVSLGVPLVLSEP